MDFEQGTYSGDLIDGEDCFIHGHYWNSNNNIQTIIGTHTWEISGTSIGLKISEYVDRHGNIFKILHLPSLPTGLFVTEP